MKLLAVLFALTSITLAHADAFRANKLVQGTTSTATAAGTTTLTATSNVHQRFTGVTTQTVVMPDATTLAAGIAFRISNDSTGTVTVNLNGGSLAVTLYAGEWAGLVLHSNGTAAGTWDVQKAPASVSSLTALTVSRALVSDGSGIIAPATTTSTEIGYVNGVTSSLCGINQSCTETNKALSDSTSSIVDASDATKKILFDAAGTTGTTTTLTGSQTSSRVLTLPDATDTLVGKATGDVFTNKSISGATNTITSLAASTITSGQIAAARGGTNLDTSASSGVAVIASGTWSAVAASTSGNVLTSNGTTWTSSAPGSVFATASKSADYTVLSSDYFITINASGATRTMTLPAAASNTGKVYIFKRTDSTVANQAIIDGNASETIDGATTYVLAAVNGWVAIISDGTNWQIIEEINPWRVDANISGASPSLGTSAQTAYVGITDAGLTLTNNTGTGVQTAQVPCSSTNAPSGTTCSAGSESIGVSFTLPNINHDVIACVSFTHFSSIGASSAAESIFQIVETPTNAQTISQEGRGRVESRNDVGGAMTGAKLEGFPHRVCGTFTFASAGQKVLRLFYEQAVSGTVNSSGIYADAAANQGQRDIHWEVYPIN